MKRKFITSVPLIALLCLFGATTSVVVAESVDNKPIVLVDFESRSLQGLSAGVKAELPKTTTAITVDCSVARTGQCSAKTSVSNDDGHVTAGAHRAEFDTSASKETFYKENSKWAYQFSLMVDNDWPVDSKDFIDIVWQFKRFSNFPDMFVAVKGKALVLRITDKRQVVLFDELPHGKWLDIKFTVNWSSTDQGKVLVEVREQGSDAIKIFEDVGPNMRADNGFGGYVKWGLYKPGNGHEFAPRSVHHDDIKIFRLN